MLGTILLVILILMLLGAIPTWPHSKQWGYYPSGGIGLVLLIIVILLLMGRIDAVVMRKSCMIFCSSSDRW